MDISYWGASSKLKNYSEVIAHFEANYETLRSLNEILVEDDGLASLAHRLHGLCRMDRTGNEVCNSEGVLDEEINFYS